MFFLWPMAGLSADRDRFELDRRILGVLTPVAVDDEGDLLGWDGGLYDEADFDARLQRQAAADDTVPGLALADATRIRRLLADLCSSTIGAAEGGRVTFRAEKPDNLAALLQDPLATPTAMLASIPCCGYPTCSET